MNTHHKIPTTTRLSTASQVLFHAVGRYVSALLPDNSTRLSVPIIYARFRADVGDQYRFTEQQFTSALRAAGFIVEDDLVRRRERRYTTDATSYGDPVQSTWYKAPIAKYLRDPNCIEEAIIGWLHDHLDDEFQVYDDVLKEMSLALATEYSRKRLTRLINQDERFEIRRLGHETVKHIRVIA
jgi:hypothetical protein